MDDWFSDPEVRADLLGSDTLERKALQADVLTRMFGEPDPEIALHLGRYEILRMLGAGGMGVVYLAHDPELDRPIALKLLRARSTGAYPQSTEQRLRDEARAMARLNHPNVVNVHDVGRHESRLFLAMEYVPGSTLTRWLSQQPRETAEILRVFIEAAEGLIAAHDAGLVHRDFKPDNVLIGEDGIAKVTDFGVAIATSSWKDDHETLDESTTPIAGTPRYMSPEQIGGLRIDARSDQFSFCVALYEALFGTHALELEDDGSRPRLTDRRGLPLRMIEAIERGMATRPDERWPSMHALLTALRDDVARRRKRWGIAAALTAAVGLAAFWLGRSASPEPEDPCLRGVHQAEAVWNDERRSAVRERFMEHGLEFADASFAATSASLDAWTDQWGDGYAGLCRTRHERSEDRYAARMSCLSDQRHRVDALVDLLAEADAGLVGEAPGLVGDLPTSEECTEGPLELEAPPPEIAEEVAELREQLVRLDARIMTKDIGTVGRPIAELRERAEALGYRPLVGEILNIEAGLYTVRNDDERATVLLREAYGIGMETRHDHLALDAATALLMSESTIRRTDVAEYSREQWNRTALHLSRRLGLPIRPEINRRHAYAGILLMHNRGSRAAEVVADAFEFIHERLEPDSHYEIRLLRDRATVRTASMDLEGAEADLRRAEALTTAWVGPDHLEHKATYYQLLTVLLGMGKYDEVLQVGEKYMVLARASNDTLSIEHILAARAMVEDVRGDHEAARRSYEELLGGPVPDADALDERSTTFANSLCFVLYQLAEHEQAQLVCESALAAVRRLWPDGSPMTSIVLNNQALIARAMGRPEEGLRLDREALAACEALTPPDERAMVYSWVGIGESLLALGRAEEAVEPLDRALEIRRRTEVAPPELGEAECLHARARGDSDPQTRAAMVAQAEQGLARLREGGPSWTRATEACAGWIEASSSSG